ncbi:MAG: hypothetical protein NE327_13115 [Lentisphaeraceae bacterium]|nr:hypothetical protein [Lentisphaeraceae bacterium]
MISPVATGGIVHTDNIQVGFKEISSGNKSATFTSPAILEIGRRLMTNSTLAGAKNSNVVNQMSRSQTEAAFVQNTQDTLSRISELTVRANSGMLNAADKEALQLEANELAEHLEFTGRNSKFNGKELFNDSQFSDMTDSLRNIDFSTSEGIASAAEAASAGIDAMSARQAELGSEQNILDHQFEANLQEQANLLEAGSKMADTDIAQSFMRLTSDSILNDVSTAMTAQAANMESSTLRALLT